MENYGAAVADASKALEQDPRYIKVRGMLDVLAANCPNSACLRATNAVIGINSIMLSFARDGDMVRTVEIQQGFFWRQSDLLPSVFINIGCWAQGKYKYTLVLE